MLAATGSNASARFDEFLLGIRREHELLCAQLQALQCEVSRLRGHDQIERERTCDSIPKEPTRSPSVSTQPYTSSMDGNVALTQSIPHAKSISNPEAVESRSEGEEMDSMRTEITIAQGRPQNTVITNTIVKEVSQDQQTDQQTAARRTDRPSDSSSQHTKSEIRQKRKARQSTFKVHHSSTLALDNLLSLEKASVSPAFEQERLPCWKRIHRGDVFEYVSQTIILIYTVFIVFETQILATQLNTSTDSFNLFHTIFNILFMIEFVLRGLLAGRRFLRRHDPDLPWNALDAFCVLTSVVDMIFYQTLTDDETLAKNFRAIRLARVIRTVRFFRTLKTLHELHKIGYALLASGRTLLCSFIVLMFIIYFFAVVLCQGAVEYRRAGGIAVTELDIMFGDLQSTFIYLLASALNGFDWHDIYRPLSEFDWMYASVFLYFIIVMLLGVMNVATAVFVESALKSGEYFKELMIMEQQRNKRLIMSHMKAIFEDVDGDATGDITIKELEIILKDPGLSTYVEALNIDTENASLLFKMLDQDGSNLISYDEFLEGCLRLKGEAKSFDLHSLIYQFRQFLFQWAEYTGYMEDQMDIMQEMASNFAQIRAGGRFTASK